MNIDYIYYIFGGIAGMLAYMWRRLDLLYKLINNHLSEINASIREMKVDIKWLKEK